MKGTYHDRLRATLSQATENGICTQESLSRVMGKTQTGVGKYLLGKGGALDVDEAATALEHIGSSLPEFLAGVPMKELSPTERLARALEGRPALRQLVEVLLPVPKTRLAAVVELVRSIAPLATARRASEIAAAPREAPRARRTTKARARHR